MVSVYIGAPVFFILLVALLILTIITLYYYDQVQKRNKIALTTNPYCFREVCASTGTPPVSLKVNEDPQKYINQDFNYCYTNAIDCGMIAALGVCTDFTAAQVTSLANFYNTQYYPRCQYGFGGNQTVPVNTQTGGGNVNSTNLVSGPNDPALVNLVQCAKKLGLASDPNVQSLQTICGSLCPG